MQSFIISLCLQEDPAGHGPVAALRRQEGHVPQRITTRGLPAPMIAWLLLQV